MRLAAVLFVLTGALGLSSGSTLAQTDPERLFGVPEGASDCSEHYGFDSVRIDVSPSVFSTVPGVPLDFSGTIENDNSYPIPDGSVLVKIFRIGEGAEQPRHDIHPVDSFYAGEDLLLPAAGEIPFSFQWNVPRYLGSGEYGVSLHFLSGKKYDPTGFSLGDGIALNGTSFSVISDAPGVPYFDPAAVTLNGESYDDGVSFSRDETVQVDVELVNPTGESRTVEVAWTLHNWSADREDALLDTKIETIILAPNESKTFRYAADPSKSSGSVTVVRAEARYEDAKSVMDIRFLRDGFDEVRLNIPGVMKYPVRAGEGNTLFSCLHATNADLVEGVKLTLTLTDSFGTVLGSYVYEGAVSGAMMAAGHDFMSDTSSSTFTLSATLEKDGEVVGAYETTYDCEDMDSSLCAMNEKPSPIAAAQGAFSASAGARVLFTLFVIVPLGLIIWLLWRRRKGGIASIIFFLVLGGLLLTSEAAEAKLYRGSWSGNFEVQNQWGRTGNVPLGVGYFTTPYLPRDDTYDIGPNSCCPRGLSDGDVFHLDSNGRKSIKFSTRLPSGYWWAYPSGFQDGFIYREGYWKHGYWRENATFSDWESTRPFFRDYYISVHPYDISVRYDGGTANVICWSRGTQCEIYSPGTMRFSVIYSSTFAKLYQPQWAQYWSPTTPVPIDEYQTTIPEYVVSFSFTAEAPEEEPNQAPSVNVSGPVSGAPNTAYPFTATATDTDGDRVRYGFDWNSDGAVDQWMPAFGYVTSGTAQAAFYSWISEGTKTFQVLAEDERGARSNWASHSITLSAVSSNRLSLCIQNSEHDTYTLQEGESRTLSAHYGVNDDCSDPDVTTGTAFSDAGRDAVSLSGTTLRADQEGNELVTASYSGMTDSTTVYVEAPSVPDNPGNGSDDPGTNWKEVTPGE